MVDNLEKMDDGLNLARVVMGESIGKVQDCHRVPTINKATDEKAGRAKGVNVRLTKMFYAVAKDGMVNAERISRT
eukprot:UN13238